MFAYLNKCFEKLKKDHILWVPYLFYCLFFSLVNKYVFKGLESLGIKEFFIFYLENVCQTIVGILFILMVVNLKDKSLDLYYILGLLKQRLNQKLIRFSIVANIPIVFLIFSVTYISANNSTADSINAFLLILFVIIGLYVVVPFVAFGYFSIIAYVLHDKHYFELIKEVILFCFKHYRLCIRWFTFILLINSISIFILPITLTDFIMRDLIVSTFQSVFLTLSMLYSYYFYKDNVSKYILSMPLDTTISKNSTETKQDLSLSEDKKE